MPKAKSHVFQLSLSPTLAVTIIRHRCHHLPVMSSLAIPSPTDSDPEDVVTALETAALFGVKADRAQAVHWLRRAAEMAGESGHDLRAVQLARLAADMSIPPPAPPAQAAPVETPPEASSSRSTASSPPPLPISASVAPSAPSRPGSVLPAPPSRSNSGPPSAPSRRSQELPVTAQGPSAPAQSKPSAPPPVRDSVPARASNPVAAALLAGESKAPLRQALRVAVKKNGAPRTYVVSLLEDGAHAPEGFHEALLVLVSPSANLLESETSRD